MDKREAILEAALELFAERGFYGAPVLLIAERAEVGTGTIYRYFESKEVLVNALYYKWKQELYRLTFENLPQDVPLRRLFHEGWRRQVEFVQKHPRAIQFLELHHHAPYLDEANRELNRRIAASLLDFYRQAQQAQIVKDLPGEVLIAITQAVLMGMMKTYWQGEVDLTPELIDQVEEACWQAIRR